LRNASDRVGWIMADDNSAGMRPKVQGGPSLVRESGGGTAQKTVTPPPTPVQVRPAAARSPAAPGKVASISQQPAATPSIEHEKNKVVHIVRRLQNEIDQNRALRRKPWLVISVLACIALPTLIAATYLLFIAADRYVSEARFAVRSSEQQTFDALGMIAGLPSSRTTSDSYIVVDYISSLDMLRALEGRLPLLEMYRDDSADFLSRLGTNVSQEDFVSYWKDRISVFYDSTKQTISLEVQAFQPEHAQRIATEIVDVVSNLVNELSAQARRDAVQFAASELARSELRVKSARDAVHDFRVANNELDPQLAVQSSQTTITELEGERSRLASQLASVSTYLADDAPSVQVMKSRIAALDGEIERIRRQVSTAPTSDPSLATSGRSAPLADAIKEYQGLLLEQEFAEKAYTAALASLDRARIEAAREQTYLAIYAEPVVADDATYPKRWMDILMVLVVCCVAWAVGALGFLSIRDHMS
jgi:capsular polysaccharide transport system permease protein